KTFNPSEEAYTTQKISDVISFNKKTGCKSGFFVGCYFVVIPASHPHWDHTFPAPVHPASADKHSIVRDDDIYGSYTSNESPPTVADSKLHDRHCIKSTAR